MAVGGAPVGLARGPAGPGRGPKGPGPPAPGGAGRGPGPAGWPATAPAAPGPATVPATPADMAPTIAVPTIAAGCGAMTIRPAMTPRRPSCQSGDWSAGRDQRQRHRGSSCRRHQGGGRERPLRTEERRRPHGCRTPRDRGRHWPPACLRRLILAAGEAEKHRPAGTILPVRVIRQSAQRGLPSMYVLALATVYDGTLAHDGIVSDEALAALERLAASGRKLILVTGRELPDLEKVFARIDVFDRVVAENGALLYTPASRTER